MNDVLKLVNVEKSFNTLSGEVEAVGDVSLMLKMGRLLELLVLVGVVKVRF